ncbi:unnamed protein product [Brassicogethes aeneus]|uniref:Uncharacterized protein n=1 Tax=Brassicogethes aeneus TaxID=1431903 RepID=A0A9P0AY22_BRAAE|nr:unnamed protein product [Brassicogethes aeneus]
MKREKKQVSGRPKKKNKKSYNTGRKEVKIETASIRTLQRRTKKLRENLKEIQDAAKIIKVEAKDVTDVGEHSEQYTNTILRHSKESALAFFLENDFSVASYKALVSDTISRNCPIYPCYDIVHQAMDECMPKNIKVSEIEVMVPLQEILNKSTERLCESVALNWSEEALYKLKLIITLGFDSSSGHVNPHQKCKNSENESSNPQQSLFVSSLILIQLRNVDFDKVSWLNPTPQSVRFCRPLQIALEKEDEEATLKEHFRLKKEIEQLLPYRFKMSNGKSARVQYDIYETLLDGKCLNTIVKNKASSRCPICLRTAHQFSNLADNFTASEANLKYGLGLLHCEIKVFEHFLGLGYRQDLKSWDVRQPAKVDFEERQRILQKRIYEKLKVRVDQVLQGHGTTNTGNVARRCFQSPELFANALEIDVQLVIDLSKIILCFKCKEELELNKLERFCLQTYCRYYELYPWARMSPTVHKLLRHGCDIARQLPLPIAYYAEDANESWHKYYKRNMVEHSRQNSREHRLLDVFNRAVYMTDPKISLMLIDSRVNKSKTVQSNLSDIQEFIKTK